MIRLFKITVCALFLLLMSGCPTLQSKTNNSSKAKTTNENIVASPTVTPAVIEKTDKETVENAESFKPQNWYILAEASGDLNGDGKDDLAAVYSQDNPDTEKQDVGEEAGEAERLLIIGLQNSAGKFERAFSGSKIILCRNCSGMNDNVVPELTIADGKLSVYQNVLATSDVDYNLEISLTNEKEWMLTKGTVENRERKSGEIKKTEIKTPMPLKDFDIKNY